MGPCDRKESPGGGPCTVEGEVLVNSVALIQPSLTGIGCQLPESTNARLPRAVTGFGAGACSSIFSKEGRFFLPILISPDGKLPGIPPSKQKPGRRLKGLRGCDAPHAGPNR